MRRPVSPVCLSLILALAAALLAGRARGTPALAAHRAPSSGPPRVTLQISAGYGEQFRRSAWIPVRVSIHNRSAALVQGTVSIPDGGGSSEFATIAYSDVYQVPVTLPPGATKQVTLYLPGQDISDQISVRFSSAGTAVTTASDSPSSMSDTSISLGVLSADPQSVTWVHGVKVQNSEIDVVNLSPATLDPVPEVLATFDSIVLSNVNTAGLEHNQLDALQRYVYDGGSLILIGGPDWQETLRPLPTSLLPGRPTGSRAVPDLSGLRTLESGAPPRRGTVVSLLTHPRGSVLAAQAGVPLVVRRTLGRGQVLYLAFDPAVDSFTGSRASAAVLSDLIRQATVEAAARMSSSSVQYGSFTDRFGPTMMRQELANVPAPNLPSLVLLVTLTVLSILLLGPLNFLLLHRLGRRELALVTVPALGLLCLGSTLGLVFHVKGDLALLNTVGVVELDGTPGSHPATMYVGLFAPLRGSYRMVWGGQALPQSLPPYSLSFSSTSGNPLGAGGAPVGMSLQEGEQTAVDFRSMNMWSTRSVALKTDVTLPGTVRANLHLMRDGSIAGVLRNDTGLTIVRPVVIAGSTVLHLNDLPPRAARAVHIQPALDIHKHDGSFLWSQVYGSPAESSDFSSWDGDPWEEPRPAAERSLVDRIHNVAQRLPEARAITPSGQVLFAGWSQNALGTLTVDGGTPRRRDLNLIIAPLSLRFPRGSFQLRAGTLGASLVDDRLLESSSGSVADSSAPGAVDLGAGESATFEFDVRDGTQTVPDIHFGHLTLAINAGGADGANIGQVYDWRAGRWVHLRVSSDGTSLRDPDRFISPSGALLVRLHATDTSGDVVITDPRHDLQLFGSATVR